MYTLSIILNLHKEGKVLSKTLDNLKKIIELKNSWEKLEIIVVLDKSNEQTSAIVYDEKSLFDTIEEVSYGDLAQSRNHGVQIATGNFIVFFDGDDYCSHGMLQSLYDTFVKHYGKKKKLENLTLREHVALFPEYLVWFPEMSKMTYAPSNPYLIQNNKFNHCYISKIATYRGLLELFPLRSNTSPYGYEDWDLNNRLLAEGVAFAVADYTLYYRKSNQSSLLAKQVAQKHIVRNSIAYSAEKMHIDTKYPQNTLVRRMFQKIEKYFKRPEQTIEIVNTIDDDITFLKSYNEKDLLTDNVHYYDTTHFHTTFSSQVNSYIALLEILKDKEKICLHDNGTHDTQHLVLETKIASWKVLSEDEKHHIFIKALMNSSLKKIEVTYSPFVKKNIVYFSMIYDKHGITYTC